MNDSEVKLQRLFAAARETEPAVPEEMPAHLATRVLAHWRTSQVRDDSWQMLVLVFRRALACAGIIMLFTLAWSYDELGDDSDNDEAYANYELRSDVMP